VIRRIFTMYGCGDGLRLIADRLTEEGVLSPAAYDQVRNRHRDPRGWSHTAIRAILTNPIYGGRRVWGKQRRYEELLDINDVAAGHVTKMKWRPRSEWIEGANPSVEALVDDHDLAAVNARLGANPGRTKPRDAQHPYLLRGVLYCGLCGRKMQGSARRSRKPDGSTRVLYRCEFGAHRSVPLDMDHPLSVHAREDAIVPRLDAWLAEIVTPESLAASQTVPDDVATADAVVRVAVADCEARIERLLSSIESGVDGELVIPRVKSIQAERERFKASLSTHTTWRPVKASEIEHWADQLGGLVDILKRADAPQRADVYASLAIKLNYYPGTPDKSVPPRVEAHADLARVGRGVEGGT
jgi:site-specific DNA recombinase